MIQIRARFQQLVPPQGRIEFSVDPYILFLSRLLAQALDREHRSLNNNLISIINNLPFSFFARKNTVPT